MTYLISRWHKSITVIITCILTLILFCISTCAKDTEIYTLVPESHNITVTIEEGGAVIDEKGIVHTESYEVNVPHNGNLSLILRANSGYALNTVRFGNQDVNVLGNHINIKNLIKDNNLVITWKKTTPITLNKTYTIVGLVTENGKPAQNVTLELRSKLKSFITGKDGKFRFDNVELGKHSLTAIRDDKVVGYLSFALEEGNKGVNVIKLPDGTFQLTIDKNSAMLELALSISDNKTMTITKASILTEKQAEESYPISTGDTTKISYWIASIFVTGTLMTLLLYKKRKSMKK